VDNGDLCNALSLPATLLAGACKLCLTQEIFADCFVSANPPFNDSDWRGALLREDSRWQYSEFPVGSANDKDDFDFVERFTQLKAEFAAQLQDEARLNTLIAQNWAKVQP
jgi:hypothetical protein